MISLRPFLRFDECRPDLPFRLENGQGNAFVTSLRCQTKECKPIVFLCQSVLISLCMKIREAHVIYFCDKEKSILQ